MVEFTGEPAATFERMTENVGKTSEKSIEMSEKTDKTSEKTDKTSEKTEKTSEKTEKTSEKTEKTSEKIVELIKANPEITIQELASVIRVSRRSIERNIQKLQKENILKRIGADKGGRWEVVE